MSIVSNTCNTMLIVAKNNKNMRDGILEHEIGDKDGVVTIFRVLSVFLFKAKEQLSALRITHLRAVLN